MSAVRVLPADVFDALELSAEAFGGIGAGFMYHHGDRFRPCCIHGLAEFAEANEGYRLNDALFGAGIGGNDNDAAVYAINARKDPNGYNDTPVTFAEWASELNVVRGAA